MYLSVCLNLFPLVDMSKPSADHTNGALKLLTTVITLQANGNMPVVCRNQG